MHYLSICAVFKNETRWLREWIEYHRIVGVEHFHLHGHIADSPEADLLLEPYVRAGIVTLTMDGRGIEAQVEMYAELHRRVIGRTVWAAFIDIDEFLYPMLCDTLPAVLRSYEQHAALVANWTVFGTSGLERCATVLDSLRRRAPDGYHSNRHVKSIVRPERAVAVPNPHCIEPLCPFRAVDEDCRQVVGPFNDYKARVLRVNHYLLRSREDFVRRRGHRYSQAFFSDTDRNEVYDDGIWRRFGPAVGERLAGPRSPADA